MVVTTIAGDGTTDSTNGPALSSKFNTPTDVAITADGAIYVAAGNGTIQQAIRDNNRQAR